MAKSLNEAELGAASGGKIDYKDKKIVLSGTNAKGENIGEIKFDYNERGLESAKLLGKQLGVSTEMTKTLSDEIGKGIDSGEIKKN